VTSILEAITNLEGIGMIPLFKQYPLLREKLPYVSLGEFPTPVQKLDGIGRNLGMNRLYIKRDDLSGSIYGGNKVRKLEFLLGNALKVNAKEVMTFGGAGSNHALATAIYARQIGLRSISMLVPQPNAHYVRRNLLMSYHCGAELHLCGGELRSRTTMPLVFLATVHQLLRHRLKSGRFPHLIPPGGSSPLGAIGFVNAAFELKEQIDNGLAPEPEYVYVASGTMGTAAGLMLGFGVLKLKSRVISVRVTDNKLVNVKGMVRLIDSTNSLLCALDPCFPTLKFSGADVEIRHNFFGQQYALFTREGMEAVTRMKKSEGIKLDGTYTGKAFAALINDTKKEDFIDTHKRTRLESNDILITNSGTIGRMALVSDASETVRTTFQKSVAIIKPDQGRVVPRWLYYYLNAEKDALISWAGGTAQKNLLLRDLRAFKLTVPPLPTQRKIAAVLSAYDDLIENNTRRIRILEEMAQMIYREWFVNFRFPGHENVKMVESELGLIPEGWEIQRLGELVDIVKGRKVKNLYDTMNTDSVPYLLIDGLRNGEYVYTDKDAGPSAQEDDVLMVMDGASSGEVFIGSVGVAGSTLAIFRPRNATLLSPYVLFLLLQERKQEIAEKNVGSAIPHANKAYITGIKLTVPPKDVSMTLHSQLKPIFQQIIILRLKSVNLRRTRDLLLPRLISGEIDVENLDIGTEGLGQ